MDKKIVGFAIIACFIVCQMKETNATGEWTLDQMLGVWYPIGETPSNYTSSNDIKCFQMNITKGQEDVKQDFVVNITLTLNEEAKQLVAFGKMADNGFEFWMSYSTLKYAYNVVQKYDNGRELIFNKISDEPWYAAWSRWPAISEEAKLKLEHLATETGTKIFYINHTGCSYDDFNI